MSVDLYVVIKDSITPCVGDGIVLYELLAVMEDETRKVHDVSNHEIRHDWVVVMSRMEEYNSSLPSVDASIQGV